MQRILVTAVLLVATVTIAPGQTNRDRSAQANTDEQEIIAASRKFAEEAIINHSAVVKHVSATLTRTITLAGDGEANPLEMDSVKVRVDGKRARLTSRLIFSGRRSDGQAYERFHSWTVDLSKRAGAWRVVRAQMGRSGK